MKTRLTRLPLALCSAIIFASLALSTFAQGTAFTYQGRLYNGTNLANGNYDMQFSLYSAATGGSIVAGPITNAPVAVSNGLFTTLIDFGPGVFIGNSTWLQVAVTTNDSTSPFVALSPLQQLTPTPNAIYAETADAAGLEGTIPTGDLSGTYGSPVTLNNSGNSFTGNGAGLLNVNSSLLDGLASTNFWQTTGNAGTTAGVNFVGTTDNQPLDLDSDGNRGLQLQYVSRSTFPLLSFTYGMNVLGGYWGNSISANVISATIAGGGDSFRFGLDDFGSYPNVVTNDFGTIGGGYGNTAGYAGTVPGGYENTASGSGSFAAGTYASATHNDSFVWSDGSSTTFSDTGPNQFQILASGGVGIGTTAGPQQGLSVREGLNIDQANLNAGYVNNGNTNGYALTFGSSSGEGIASERVSGGGNQYGLDFFTSFDKRATISQAGDMTIDGGQLFLTSGSTTSAGNGVGFWTGLPGIIPGDAGTFIYGYDGGALGAVGPTTVCLSWNYSGDVWISNNCSVATLTIRGGADLAEPFKMSESSQSIPQGAVVVIDPQNPGRLKMSDSPYDTRVAGVVSGANGVNPGIQMHQDGMIEGGKNVSLSGRVYVQADTSNGAILPGDMLTTSSTPGHAMRVSDHARAAGAILGKAMTGLSEGKGMVLVLVTLQ
jgi:hypothetical protein